MSEVWSVKDVMDYFGEELRDIDMAKAVMDIVEVRLPGRHSYTEYMNEVRKILMESGYNVPFRAGYRRVK